MVKGRQRAQLGGRHIALVLCFIAAVCGAAAIQHLVVQGILPRLSFYLIPALVGGTFGYLVVRIMALRDEQRACIREMEDQEQQIRQLNVELEGKVQVRTEQLASTQQQLLQAQKMEAIGMLAGGIAHEFNNVLTTVVAVSSLLLAGEADEKKRSLLREIERAGDRANTLTRQLLTLGKKQERKLERVEINALIAETLPMLQTTLAGAAELVARPCAVPLAVEVDRTQLEQVLLNLVLNARDATARGASEHAKVTISTERVVPSALPSGLATLRGSGVGAGHVAALTVEDNGAGIAPEDQARIFDPFFSTKGAGSGLGLSVTYSIVQQAGGEITVTSERGRGARFTIYLPVAA